MNIKLGMLIPEFPGQTHAFFWREVEAIEAAGATVSLLSTRRPASACPHAFRDAAVARTQYLFPPRWGKALGFLMRHPAATARGLRYIAGLSETKPIGRVKLMGLLPSAAELVLACQHDAVAHVHIHSCATAAHLGHLAHILGGITYSLTLHGNLPVYGTDHGAKMAQATFVSAVTRPLADEIATVAPTAARPVIMMGVDTARFTPNPNKIRAADAPFQVVSVARLNYTKGHRFFLRAMAQLVKQGYDIHYKIAGDGPEGEAISQEIQDLGLSEHVEMLGAVSEDQVLELLRGADVLALTSIGHGEAAPVAVMEAMACGLAVISSIIGGTPDMIEDGKDGLLVTQEDVGQIAQALERLITEDGLRAQLAREARATSLEKFDYNTNALRLLAAIQSR